MAQQLSVFVDNKPGRLNAVTAVLRDQGINIRAMTIADHRDYGVAKLLVSDPQRALAMLAEQGFAVALKPVSAVALEDRPGGLHELLDLLAEHRINVLDAYGFVITPGRQAVWCMEVADPEVVARLITAHGLRLLADSELYRL